MKPLTAVRSTAASHDADDALTRLSATELAAKVAAGEISSVETVQAHIRRIEAVNASLNAVVVKRYDAALAEAREADKRRAAGGALGPLHGVPVTLKECLDLAGTPSTFGLPSRARHAAPQDDTYAARLRQAGAIVLGKTNVAQLLFYYESDNPVYGRTNNPWNAERTPGGSSGGEAAIIAAGGSALGLGTDIGGSLRVPATFCGIASLKPTMGRFPDPGRFSLPIGQRAVASQIGVMARRVADVALGTEILNGGRNPACEPPMPLGDFRGVDVAKLRVGFYTDDGTFTVAPAVRRAVREAAESLRAAGADVQEWSPPDVASAQNLLFGIFSADGAEGLRRLLHGQKRDPRVATLAFLAHRSRPTLALLRGLLRAVGQRGLADSTVAFGHGDTAHYWRLVEQQMNYQRRFAEALDAAAGGPIDVILCPACALPAFHHGASANLLTAGAYAILYNLLGYPAGVVPVTRVRPGEDTARPPSRDVVQSTARKVEVQSAGLPVGVQVVARPWREHVALAAMHAIEDAASRRADFPSAPPL